MVSRVGLLVWTLRPNSDRWTSIWIKILTITLTTWTTLTTTWVRVTTEWVIVLWIKIIWIRTFLIPFLDEIHWIRICSIKILRIRNRIHRPTTGLIRTQAWIIFWIWAIKILARMWIRVVWIRTVTWVKPIIWIRTIVGEAVTWRKLMQRAVLIKT